MFRVLNFLWIVALILHHFGDVIGAKYQCDMIESKCVLKELKLTRNNYQIVPVASNLDAVTKIILQGTVPVLSAKEICKAMPNLNKFVASEVSMEEIPENAFESCNKLDYLDLDENKFIKIHRNAFKGLSNLNKLWIKDGNLQNLDLDLTDSKNLSLLAIRNLNIVNFSVNILREQTNLEILSLYSNNLFDLNVEEIIKNKPKLDKILLNDNNFKCDRLKEILDLLKDKNIKADPFTWSKLSQTFPTNKINGIICLTNEQWESEFSTLPLDQQLWYSKMFEFISQNLNLLRSKFDTLEKNQQASVLNCETKLNDKFEKWRNESMYLLESREEKILILQKGHSALQENFNEEIPNLKKNIRTLTNIYQDSEKTTREELEGLIEDMNTIDEKILSLEANQTKQNGKIETIFNNDLKIIQSKVDGQLLEVKKSLEKINAKIDSQDSQITKMQENMNKFLDTLSNLMFSQSSGINMLEQKIKDLKHETSTKFETLNDDLQKFQNDTRAECHRIVNENQDSI